MTYLLLAFEFFKTGLFSIGGGLATLPYLMQMTHTHPDWFTMDELMNMIAVSESTPGPIGVNMASYVGYTVGDVLGALVATFSIVLPSFIVILIVVRVLDRFRSSSLVKGALEGLHPAVTGLIAAAGFSVLWASVFRTADGVSLFQWLPFVLFIVFFAATQWKPLKKLHPIIFILIGGILGVLFKL